MNYTSGKDDQKNNSTIALILYTKKSKNKKKKDTLPTFQNTTQSAKNKLFS